MELQTSSNGARRGVLDGNFFTLLRNLVNTVRNIGHIKFEVEFPRLLVPHRETGGQISGEMLRQSWSMLDDGAASVAQRGTCSEAAPAIGVKQLPGPGMGLIECRNNLFACH